MRLFSTAACIVLACLAAFPLIAGAQQMPNPYGESIGLDAARKAADAALAEAKKNSWNVAVAIVDPHGELVFFQRMDPTQHGSIRVAQEKARSAAQFKRPTKVFEDAVKGQNINLMGLPGAVPVEGGVPIVMSGKIVGAIGVSGGTSAQDGQCAKVGIDAITPQAQAGQSAPQR
jgi:glc operon protein GlcG